jgi:tripartite-type tricarboxylate transporter receptor subunit TctC
MTLPRRRFLHLAAGAAALSAAPRIGWAQAYPSKPVRIIVAFGAGGGIDFHARLIGQWLTERLGQTIVVENRPGAGGNIGTEVALKSPADGYTLFLIFSSHMINATLFEGKLDFDFLRDTAPVAGIVRLPQVVMVNPSFAAKTLPELIAYAKANPGKINFGSGGVGTPGHVAVEQLKMMTGTDMVHVPYRGSAPAMTDLLGGRLQLNVFNADSALPQIRAGKVRALAVGNTERLHVLPDVPTVAETVPGYEASLVYGIGAPKGTPPEIINRLNKEINAGLADPKIKARLQAAEGVPLTGSAADFGKILQTETEKWAKVVRFAKLKPRK